MPLQGAGLKAEWLAEMMGAMECRRGRSQLHIAIRQLVRIPPLPAENKQNREGLAVQTEGAGRPAPQLHLFSLEEPPARLLVPHLPVQAWV